VVHVCFVIYLSSIYYKHKVAPGGTSSDPPQNRPAHYLIGPEAAALAAFVLFGHEVVLLGPAGGFQTAPSDNE
jgi:ABC-type Co2+ transport system permease subunit